MSGRTQDGGEREFRGLEADQVSVQIGETAPAQRYAKRQLELGPASNN